MQKKLIFLLVTLTLVILLIPTLLVSMQSDPPAPAVSAHPDQEEESKIRIYLTKEKRVAEIPLESYIRGVVASEMPAYFHVEALKAQALAARTYVVERLMKKDFSDMERWGNVAATAHVTDTIQHQVYSTDEQLRKQWGTDYEVNLAKIDLAVRATHGQIITYQDRPIYAAFFSTSNGRTENSEDYFTAKYPYLRSVESVWDKESPKYERVHTINISELTQRLEKYSGRPVALPASVGESLFKLLGKTEGNRISQVQIGDQKFSGREVREALQLASSDFSWNIKGNQVVITTRGYGHGVGMSQWGAHLMAQQGKKVTEIIQHYYHGVEVKQMELAPLMTE